MCEENDIIALYTVMSIMGALGLRWSVVEARYLIRGEVIWMEDSRVAAVLGALSGFLRCDVLEGQAYGLSTGHGSMHKRSCKPTSNFSLLLSPKCAFPLMFWKLMLGSQSRGSSWTHCARWFCCKRRISTPLKSDQS